MSFLKSSDFRSIIVSLVTILVIGDYFLRLKPYNDIISLFLKWGIVIAGFAMLLGVYTIVVIHGREVGKRTPGRWYLSVWTLLIIFLTTVLGLSASFVPEVKAIHNGIMEVIYKPLTTGLFALLGYWFTGIVFRAFRGRNRYVAIFLLSGFLMVLYNTPALKSFGLIMNIGDWLLRVPNVAGARGIEIGAGIAIVALAVRSILRVERGAGVA
jgi:hypothetical protein